MKVMASAMLFPPVSEPVQTDSFSPHAYGPYGAFGRIVVDGDTTIHEEQGKGCPPVERIADRFC